MNWYAVYTKPRAEKKVTDRLEQLGIDAYCPMITRIRQWSDRKQKVLVPVIQSHVFVQLEEQERTCVFQVPGVLRYLFWLGKPAVIRGFEIEVMKKVLSGKIEKVAVSQYHPGDRLKIPNGIFKDKEAILHKRDGKHLYLFLEQTGLQIIITLG